MVKNTIQYNFSVTHRDNYQAMARPLAARQELLQFMKQTLHEMGLYFLQVKTPVVLMNNNSDEMVTNLSLDNNSKGTRGREGSSSSEIMGSPLSQTSGGGGSVGGLFPAILLPKASGAESSGPARTKDD